jgi:peptidoglycan hydrolase-like protein with peptidoglycan-binding domain
VADLRIEDAALAQAQATLRTAGDRLAPVVQTLRGLDTEVVGADPLIGQLQDAQELLGADLGIVGQALVELAARAATINAVFTQADQQLRQVAVAAN